MEYESPEILASYAEEELVEEAAVCHPLRHQRGPDSETSRSS